MSTLFPNLFSPYEIRGKRFKNRLFFAPHGTGYAEGGGIGERGLAYYRARVKNNIALLTSEATHVVQLPGQKYAQLSAGTDDCVSHFSKLAALCAEHDCRYFGQLYHEGRARAHLSEGARDVAVAPSALPDERFHIVPQPMSVEAIESLVEDFGAAAGRLARANADGAEVLVGMGYLHAQFISEGTNIRRDQYGGSLENRSRFLRETLLSMREHVGEDFIIGFRIVPDEPDPDGQSPDDSIAVCQAMAKDGLCDYISVTVGGTHSLAGASLIAPPMFFDATAALDISKRMRDAVDVPVFVAGRINQPQQAELAISSQTADMVGSVRSFIADPEFATKALEDRPDDIRACIACNQACVGHRQAGFGVSCIQFPETGRELEYGSFHAAQSTKKVVVVGGGPAGMKTAVVAAQRGHHMTIYEAGSRLGGQALLAQALPGRAEFGGLITNLEREIDQHNVEVVMDSEVSADMLSRLNPDAIVVATGAVPYQFKGDFGGANVVNAWEVLQGRAKVEGRVVVADWRCDWVGPGIAELLATQGHPVKLCVNGETLGQSIQAYVRYFLVGRLHSLGVEVVPYMRLFGADEDTVYMQHIMTEEAVVLENVDTLVLAYGHQSVYGLYQDLEGHVPELYAVGDCLNPRTAEEAILEGLKIGAAI